MDRKKIVRLIGSLVLGFFGVLAIWAGLTGRGVEAPKVAETIPTPAVTRTSVPLSPSVGAGLEDPKGKPKLIEMVDVKGKVYVRAKIEPTFLTKSFELDPPRGVVGWYAEPTWPVPGAMSNQRAVLAAHDAMSGKAEPFYELPKAKKGDKVRVSFDSGDVVEFEVLGDAVSLPKGAAVDLEKNRHIWYAKEKSKEQVISLITCDLAAQHVGGSSVNNVVVQAKRMA